MGIIIKQGIKGTIMTYLGMMVGFITTFFVLTRYLTAEEIGLTRVLIDASVLLAGLASMGTNASIIRFFPYFKDEEHNDHGFFLWTVLMPLLGFCIISLLYFLLYDIFCSIFSEKSALFTEYYYAVLPLTFCILYLNVFEVNANALMRIVVPKFVREVLVRVLLLAAYLVYAFRYISLSGLVVSICFIYGIASVVNIFYLLSLKKISFKPDFSFLTKPLLKNYFFYTFFLVIVSLGTIVVPNLNTFFVSAQLGLTQTGIFAIATYMATLIEIPYRSLGAISLPQISQTVKDNDIESMNRLSKSVSLHQLLAGTFVFFFIWINIDLIFAILPNGQQYAEGKWVVFWLGMAKLITSVFSIDGSILSFSKFYYYSLFLTIVMTISTIVLNNLLIPIMGIDGSALATMLSCTINYLLYVIVVWYKVGVVPMSFKMIYVLAIIAILYFMNIMLVRTCLYFNIISQNIIVQIVEAFLRSGVLLLLGIGLVVKFSVSVEVNNLVALMKNKIIK